MVFLRFRVKEKDGRPPPHCICANKFYDCGRYRKLEKSRQENLGEEDARKTSLEFVKNGKRFAEIAL